MNYKKHHDRLLENEFIKRKIISEEIKTSLKMFDVASEMLESTLDHDMIEMSNRIINFYVQDTSFFSKTNAKDIAAKADLNTSLNDLYIFNSDKVIFKTTFEKDLGFDFKKLGPRYIRFLDSINEIGHCFPERTSIQYSTNRPKKYSYHATPDKKYILELGFTSSGYESLQNLMFNSIDTISKNYKEIRKITLYMATEIFPTFDRKAILKEDHKPIMTSVYKTGKEKTITEIENGNRISYTYSFIDMKGSNMHDGWIIQFITDDSNEKKLINQELLNLGWLLLLTVLPLILIVYFGTKRLTNPIKKLVQKVNRISSGNLSERVEISGNNEITELSFHFNKMVDDLEESYSTLEQKVITRTLELANEKKQVEEKQKEIIDSIRYAKRIQSSLLTQEQYIEKNIKRLRNKN